MLDENLKLVLAPEQSPFSAVAGTPAGVTPKMLLSIAGLYSTGPGAFFWGGVHGTWFWVDPVNDVVVGMVQQVDAGNAMTGRPYPVTDIRGVSRSLTYGAPVDPAR